MRAEQDVHMIGYVFDDAWRAATNEAGENYWFSYIEELLDSLGLRAEQISPEALATRRELGALRALILGDCDVSALPDGAGPVLRGWVEGGGVLVGLGTTGLDELFGVEVAEATPLSDPFVITGRLSLDGRDEVSGVLDGGMPQTECPVMAPIRRLRTTVAASLTDAVCEPDGADVRFPAITRREIGGGKAFYFAFSLTQALWTYHRGRPVTGDLDGDGYMRTGDGILVPPGPEATVPGGDLLLLVLENMLAPCSLPFVHQLPPLKGQAPDALFYFAGDDESADGLQARMSELMASFGLPYHINVMLGADGKHHFTDEDMALYERNGHEVSLHFNFINFPDGVEHPAPVEEAEYERQLALYRERFGHTPVCANTHWLRASGWADTARLGVKHGLKGEHSRVHHPSPPMDPVNLFGTVFGTVFPHFVYDDAEHGNARLDFVDLPITFYEPGSVACEDSHPFHGRDPFRPDEYRRVVGMACRNEWTLNFFMHPCHMHAEGSRGRDALRTILDEVERRGASIVHMGTDALCLWWLARGGTRVAPAGEKGDWEVETDHAEGVLIRFLAAALPAPCAFAMDGGTVLPETRKRRGQAWLYVHVPQGRHRLAVVEG